MKSHTLKHAHDVIITYTKITIRVHRSWLTKLEPPALVVGTHQASDGGDDSQQADQPAGQVDQVETGRRDPDVRCILHAVDKQCLVVSHYITDELARRVWRGRPAILVQPVPLGPQGHK